MDASINQALSELAERYAAGADHRDGDLYASAFLPDGRLFVHNPAPGPALSERGGRAALSQIPAMLDRYDTTFHFLGNRRYQFDTDGTAHGEVSCIAHHLDRAKATDFVMHIRYDDSYARGDDGEWGIETRRCRVLWTETRTIDT